MPNTSDCNDVKQAYDHLRHRLAREERQKRWAKMPPIKRFFSKVGYYSTQATGAVMIYLVTAIIVMLAIGLLLVIIFAIGALVGGGF